MIRTTALAALLFLSSVDGQETGNADAAPVSLAELAASADLVVLAQVKDTDYFMQRDIPVSGSAYFKVLIPYKAEGAPDILEVYEKGLHPNECYFPNPTVFEEGRRYLLFLVKDPEVANRYRGLPQGCALEVLVNDRNLYALRYPVDGIALSDPLDELAVEMKFSDSYAITDDTELLPSNRDSMRDSGMITSRGSGRWIYTRGILLSSVSTYFTRR